MGRPRNWNVAKVAQRKLSAPCIHCADGELAAKRGQHFQIDQFRRREFLASKSRPRGIALHSVVRERNDESARVNDEHGRREVFVRRLSPARNHRTGPQPGRALP